MAGPKSPEEYGTGFTDQGLEAGGWAVGLDVWDQVRKAYEMYLGDATLANSQLYSLQQAIARQVRPPDTDNISDGHHTFKELYDHRRALTAALVRSIFWGYEWPGLRSWKSKAHHPDDDPMFEGGYFIVGIDLPTGTITYHYKLSHWEDFPEAEELEHAPKWDGAGPPETVERLLAWARE